MPHHKEMQDLAFIAFLMPINIDILLVRKSLLLKGFRLFDWETEERVIQRSCFSVLS
jgi:hypothetical protein